VSALPFSADNIKIVQEGLRKSVTEGTASGLNIPGVEVAGKTGTAELGVTKAEVNTWVTGYWPYEHPRYAFAVMMERGPRANTVGATYVMRQLLEWMREGAPEYLK
jgi:penicillin-binding protein 2